MKKGIQYSHYCGTELLELVSSIRMSMDNEEVTINLGYDYITTNNYTIQLFILIFILIILIFNWL